VGQKQFKGGLRLWVQKSTKYDKMNKNLKKLQKAKFLSLLVAGLREISAAF